MQMNKLEKAILDGSLKAHRDYEKMSGGWWLWHAPEAFLQYAIAQSITKLGYDVFPEASPVKINDEHDKPLRGRPLKNKRQRFDLVVWSKSSEKVRAIIEIKRGGPTIFGQIPKDGKKLKAYLNKGNSDGTGYLLFYHEGSGPNRLNKMQKRIEKLRERLKPKGWVLFEPIFKAKNEKPETDGTAFSWCVGLMRYHNSA